MLSRRIASFSHSLFKFKVRSLEVGSTVPFFKRCPILGSHQLQQYGCFGTFNNLTFFRRYVSLVTRSGDLKRRRLLPNHSFRFNHSGTNSSKKQHLFLSVVKTVLLVTGASVWAALILVYFWVEDFKVEKSERIDLPPPEVGSIPRDLRFLGITSNEGDLDEEAVVLNDSDWLKNEINLKLSAFNDVWRKLCKEDGVLSCLGAPVEICGYKCNSATIDDADLFLKDVDEKNKWFANCYIEGKRGAGVLSILFERVHTESDWIPTKVHLETLKESGEVICNVSGNLPNGLRNFTRLSDL